MRVSVLLPVYNAAATIGAAVESILRQDATAVELIVVDDGSTDGTDGTAHVVDRLADRHTGAVSLTIMRTTHRGVVPALTTGFEASRGDYIAHMDADDTCDPSRLRLQAEFLDNYPEIGVVGSRGIRGEIAAFLARRGYRYEHDWIAAG